MILILVLVLILVCSRLMMMKKELQEYKMTFDHYCSKKNGWLVGSSAVAAIEIAIVIAAYGASSASSASSAAVAASSAW